jgi:hypothetical protein
MTSKSSFNFRNRYCIPMQPRTALPPVDLLQCERVLVQTYGGNSNCDVTEVDLRRVTELMSPQYDLMWERSGKRRTDVTAVTTRRRKPRGRRCTREKETEKTVCFLLSPSDVSPSRAALIAPEVSGHLGPFVAIETRKSIWDRVEF